MDDEQMTTYELKLHFPFEIVLEDPAYVFDMLQAVLIRVHGWDIISVYSGVEAIEDPYNQYPESEKELRHSIFIILEKTGSPFAFTTIGIIVAALALMGWWITAWFLKNISDNKIEEQKIAAYSDIVDGANQALQQGVISGEQYQKILDDGKLVYQQNGDGGNGGVAGTIDKYIPLAFAIAIIATMKK